ncbi:MAG: hypothetical protein KDC62_07355 [Aequorivita sp.]|nr:hypothetical protein [Aequorivita sp.]
MALFFYFEEEYTALGWGLLASLGATMLYQLYKVLPYSSLFPRRRSQVASDGKTNNFLKSLFSDVLAMQFY